MSSSVSLQPTRCAVCGTPDNATEIYPANFDVAAFNPAVFSARRLPDRLHYRMVKCKTCGLLRSDPVADAESLKQLYSQSAQNYGSELTNIRSTYGRYLGYLDKFNAKKNALLEIGCGSGFFMEEALARGFWDVWGIEPSQSAAAQATPRLRGRIVLDVLRPGVFPDNSFDVICMFQVFDHLPDPNTALDVCRRLLKPGGHVLALNHDASSFSARLMGESSPIIDIEHTYLYDRKSMAAMFHKHGFQVLSTGSALNHYSLHYLIQLMPLPRDLKEAVLRLLRPTRIARVGVTVSPGNLFVIATPSATG